MRLQKQGCGLLLVKPFLTPQQVYTLLDEGPGQNLPQRTQKDISGILSEPASPGLAVWGKLPHCPATTLPGEAEACSQDGENLLTHV